MDQFYPITQNLAIKEGEKMITLNKSQCKQCGKCVRICPFTVLKMKDGYPELEANKPCINCYHCVCVCEDDALSPELKSEEDALALQEDKDFSDKLSKLIKSRRSIRKYKDQAIEREVLLSVLDAVKMCASAKNQQPVKWVIVEGKDKTKEIMNMVLDWVSETGNSPEIQSEYQAGNNVVTLDAPNLLICYADERTIAPQVDCMIAVTSAELLLNAHGIGTCHAGYLRRISNSSEDILKYLGIPEKHQVCGILTAGYAERETYPKLPKRNAPEVKWI